MARLGSRRYGENGYLPESDEDREKRERVERMYRGIRDPRKRRRAVNDYLIRERLSYADYLEHTED